MVIRGVRWGFAPNPTEGHCPSDSLLRFAAVLINGFIRYRFAIASGKMIYFSAIASGRARELSSLVGFGAKPQAGLSEQQPSVFPFRFYGKTRLLGEKEKSCKNREKWGCPEFIHRCPQIIHKAPKDVENSVDNLMERLGKLQNPAELNAKTTARQNSDGFGILGCGFPKMQK